MTNDKEKVFNRHDLINHREVEINSLFNLLNKEEGRFWLEQYIKKFVSTKEEFYINYLWESYDFLWDNLSVFNEISITSYEEIKYCFEIENEILFFWDEPGGMAWGMDISDVFKTGFNKLFDNLNVLPIEL